MGPPGGLPPVQRVIGGKESVNLSSYSVASASIRWRVDVPASDCQHGPHRDGSEGWAGVLPPSHASQDSTQRT